jgi:hypothetical protein
MVIHILNIGLTKHLAVEETNVLLKGRVIVKQYTPKKHKQFGIKPYKLCDSKRYTFMPLYPLIQCPQFQLSAVYCGLKKNLKIKEINGS